MNDVVVRGGGAVQGFRGLRVKLLEGLEGFTPQQLGLRPLELRIISKIDRQDYDPEKHGKPGQLRLGNRFFDHIECVFLKGHRFRTLAEGPAGKQRTTCVSADGWDPHEAVPEPKSLHCSERIMGDRERPMCPYSLFNELPDGTKKPPLCSDGGALLGVMPALEYLPFWFPVKGTSWRLAMRVFLVELQAMAGANALHQFPISITTQRQQKGGNSWYTPVFTVAGSLYPYEAHAEIAAAVGEAVYVPFFFTEGAAASDDGSGEPAPVTVGAMVPPPADDDIPF